jgi:hypothetical protein
MQIANKKHQTMLTKTQLDYIKARTGHAFDMDANGNLTLKTLFGIPQFNPHCSKNY